LQAFETLTPKSIVQRYTSLLLEQKRLILSGPPASGKSHMAQRLAHFLVDAAGDNAARGSAIITFTIQVC
jgi:DNA replication protein DnaC